MFSVFYEDIKIHFLLSSLWENYNPADLWVQGILGSFLPESLLTCSRTCGELPSFQSSISGYMN
jgi:hypothetical protein